MIFWMGYAVSWSGAFLVLAAAPHGNIGLAFVGLMVAVGGWAVSWVGLRRTEDG